MLWIYCVGCLWAARPHVDLRQIFLSGGYQDAAHHASRTNPALPTTVSSPPPPDGMRVVAGAGGAGGGRAGGGQGGRGGRDGGIRNNCALRMTSITFCCRSSRKLQKPRPAGRSTSGPGVAPHAHTNQISRPPSLQECHDGDGSSSCAQGPEH